AYRTLDEAIQTVRKFPKPLSLYLFSTNQATQQRVLGELSFGGGCINNTLVHLSNPNLPFGGVGESGMGGYHGQDSFETFSHRKGVVKSMQAIDPSVRYQPYRDKLKWVRMLLR
ncbi:MAG: aldehyde dehydrogenase, partial [Firmicutes bacterium]|nr:aldehyde dehydrogenase [Bacillota bacterium]